jgi:undecaprenyl phosphate N,N'-diacetylbacillosamine 1-phosphate transferase
VRPGITGLAQVTVRNSASWEERIRIDVEYVEKFSLLFDISILLRTLWRVATRKSIYA